MSDWTVWVELAGKLLKIIADAAGGDVEDLIAELKKAPALDEPSDVKRALDMLEGFEHGLKTDPKNGAPVPERGATDPKSGTREPG